MTSPDLGRRLIDAASDAFNVGTFNFDAVVAGVLRALIPMIAIRAEHNSAPDYSCGWSDAYQQVVEDLKMLADSIEKGDSGG